MPKRAALDTGYVRTQAVRVTINITISVDEQTVNRAREVARQQGTSLNALIRDYLERLARVRSDDEILAELQQLWAEGGGRSGGDRFRTRRRVRGSNWLTAFSATPTSSCTPTTRTLALDETEHVRCPLRAARAC